MIWIGMVFLAGFIVIGFVANDSASYGLAGLFLILSIVFVTVGATRRATDKKKVATPVRTAPDPTLQDPAYCDKCGSKL